VPHRISGHFRQGVSLVCFIVSLLGAYTALRAAQQPGRQDAERSLEEKKLAEIGLAPDTRPKMIAALMTRTTEIDRVCQLSPEQKQKLQLMGQGDIKHYFDAVRACRTDPNENSAPEILILLAQDGLFQDSSLFCKSIPNVLNARQLALLAPTLQEARKRRQQKAIDFLMETLERDSPFEGSERGKLAALFGEIPPSGNNGVGAAAYLALRICAMAERQGDRFPNAKRRNQLVQLASEVKGFEPALRQAGYFPADEDQQFSRGRTPAAGEGAKK
jgi:hypothetical protein